MRLSELHAMIGAFLTEKGDTEHVAVSIAMGGNEPRRVDVFGDIEILHDTAQYPNGIAYLVGEYVPPTEAPQVAAPKRRARGKAAEKEDPVHQRITHPRPGHTVHRCVG